MPVTPQQLKESIQVLYELSDETIEPYEVDACQDDEQLMLLCEEAIRENSTIKFCFPQEDEHYNIAPDDLVSYMKEYESLVEDEHVTAVTDNMAFQLVDPQSDLAHAVTHHEQQLSLTTDEGTTVHLSHQPLLAGLLAVKKGAYGDHLGPMSLYQCVEVHFSGSTVSCTPRNARSVIDAYLFELAASHEVVFSRAQFWYDLTEPWWVYEKPGEFKLRPLEGANEGIRLFFAASQVEDPELRVFSFYKVLEHFAPTVLNLDAHEAVRKKLDSPAALAPDGQFVRELLQLSKSFDQRRNERSLIRGVLLAAVDLVRINDLLPEALRQDISHETSPKDLEKYASDLAEHICATRNDVAHAKATHNPTGYECPRELLPDFASFLRAAARDAIRWYNRLPDHQRVEP